MHYPEHTLWSLRRGRSDPLGFLTSLAARGDFVPFTIAGQRAVLLNRPDYIDEVLVSHASKFSKGFANQRAKLLLGTGLLTADGPLHADRRRLIQPAFGRQRLESYGAVMASHARGMRDTWREGDVVDVPRAMGRLTFGIVGETVIGADVSAHYEEVRQAVRKATASLDALVSLLAPLRRVRPEQTRLHQIVDRLLAAGSGDEGSLLSLLMAHDSSPDQLRDDLLTILLAGHDTLTNALTWTWLLLATHGEAEARLQEEVATVLGDSSPTGADLPRLPYARGVLAEALRLYPPAWVLARRAIETHEVDAGVIPSGALVLVSQYLMHRDRRYFESPLSFAPERWLGDHQAARPKMAYFPFGAGARSCIGEAFGWMEGVLVLTTIAQRWRLRPVDTGRPDIDVRITLRPRQEVLMHVVSSDSGKTKETRHADQVAAVSENASAG